ncbi:UDP-glycosyltransferase 76B1-like isoform X2 [Magnolia sinica]|uniref:UDP-glycosyltransferase 76B1-like isoform X2 n=1 Tax=Magnolia sinica TaxID=86752 RepID=UPI00265B21F9|nr:UDP-glycosyltransferase 76B1-like isoform X2 [Magnolia sinica]
MEVLRDMQIQGTKVPHLVILPLPFQGHINPMLQLATLLQSKGFSITLIHTHFNSPNPSNYPNFNFEPIPDGLSDSQLWTEDPVKILYFLNDTCQAPFHDRLSRLLSDGPVTCIITDEIFYFTKAVADQLKLPRILLNTGSATYATTTASLKLLQQNGLLSITVGPLCKFSPGSSNSLLTQDYSCMAWLDKQAPQTVIYVSFGSTASFDKRNVVEIAWGLANSDQPFLWVIRRGSIHGHDQVELPEGFEEKTRERGQIVNWAPQQKVLAHPSVGGFWTHNGWNSTLESICEGVPMICSPYLWDQNLNARYVSHVWRVGIQLENGFDRSEIEWAIRRLMVEIEGKDIRERVRDLKENAMHCIEKGGSSYESLDGLVDIIMSL